ncbi:MAG: hypothetical protein COX51_03495 [Syntrophobacteraceae bacterium CG23_combo_of_CG06-09_8_20_14_all_50_8]|nr:MAG: hypothetical protein COX51_03495 [Syntrophobacteraceae bacterium CG23_combo_of_CG06-09_8_20_14_all_50_8]
MEAGCRTVVGQRLKQSGMHWTVRGANSIIALINLSHTRRTPVEYISIDIDRAFFTLSPSAHITPIMKFARSIT